MDTITQTIEKRSENFMTPDGLHKAYSRLREYLLEKKSGKMPWETETGKGTDDYPIVENDFSYLVSLDARWLGGDGLNALTVNVTYLNKNRDFGEKKVATLKGILEREVDGQLLLQ